MTERYEKGSDPAEVKNWRVHFYCLAVSFGALALGYDVSVMGGTLILPSFERDFGLADLSEKEFDDLSSNILSAFQAGLFFGALASYLFAERYGRKWSLCGFLAIFMLGAALMTGSRGSLGLLIAGRVVAGLGIGTAAPVIPVYIAEISPPSIRGRLVGFFEIGLQASQMCGFWVNYAVNRTISPQGMRQWQVPLGLQLLPGFVMMILLPLCPETPRWLCKKNRFEEAERVLCHLRQLPASHAYIVHEMHEIREDVMAKINGKALPFKAQWKELFKKGIRNRVGIGLALMMCQNMTGVQIITYYSPRIFETLGIKSVDLKLFATGFFGIAKTLGIAIFAFWVADYLGRRKGLIYGAWIGAIPMFYIGGYVMKADPVNNDGVTSSGWGYLAMVCIYLYGVIFCATWQGISSLYASEIYPLHIRTLCMAITIADERAWSYVVSRATPYMISDLGYGTYFFYGSLMVVMGFWVIWCIRETKGVPIEEMDNLFGAAQAESVPDSEKQDGSQGHVEVQMSLDDAKAVRA
ncbi:general substrate transporter [Macrophomina phaseolina]|uniref:General substrate transporter n=1 Tax=Macrophomina phaseolina TaxID=35725 RepID=A0ABQ8G9Z0_9PEZI|nr:general substrate transporter [Macrophomina phaseolina]